MSTAWLPPGDDAAADFGDADALAAGAMAGGGVSAAALAAPAGGARVLDFRRRAVPPRRRRRSLALVLIKPLGLAVLTVALPLSFGSWLLASRRFQLRGITVRHRPAPAPALMPGSGAPRVGDAWVTAALAPLSGRNLLRLPLAEVRQRLAGNPWIATADLAKQLPDHLVVTIAERQPAVLLRSDGRLLFADAAGHPIAPVASAAEEADARRRGLLLVSFAAYAFGARQQTSGGGGADAGSGGSSAAAGLPALGLTAAGGAALADERGIAGALRLADQLRRLRPDWTPALSQIDVIDEEDYRLRIDGLPCPLLVRGSRLAENLSRFEQLLPELTRRYAALAGVDLRFSRRIVVQPAPAAIVPQQPPPAPGAGA